MTRAVIIGAGPRGKALLDLLREDPDITIVGVADVDEQAAGAVAARQLGLRVTNDFRPLLEAGPDLIIDSTNDPEVGREIRARKSEHAEVIGPSAIGVLWDFVESKLEASVLRDRYRLVLRELEAHWEGEFITGQHPRMREISELIAKVAPTPTTVLIRGETGTGKELVARAIHRHSALAAQPLLTLNCTALSPALLESELFGYKRGAFTGAVGDRIGLFEKADGGTIFLDEIGDMSLDTQAKVLRTLQMGEIRAVGDVVTKTVSVRVIAATNRNLERAIAEGKFREDLFYRVNTFTITLPPLRERIEDVPVLANAFLQRASAKVNKRMQSISAAAIALLESYAWPGNLRELENVIERAVVLAPDTVVEPEHLPLHVRGDVDRIDGASGFMENKARAITRYEKDALREYLSRADGNISRAAELAKLPRRTFHRLMTKHALSSHEFKRR